MDTELFQHIVQMLRSEFPTLSEKELLNSAKELYNQSPRRLENLSGYDLAQEKAQRIFDESWNAKPQKGFFDMFLPTVRRK